MPAKRPLLWLTGALAAALLGGCAAREPSSTDDHNRVPKVWCHLTNVRGSMREVCCVGERCWFAD
jgi:hypothetical protein